jgi:hypothetical protein
MNRRTFFALATCLVLFAAAGCKSNNADGRLVGKWNTTSLPNAPGVTMTWVFGADHSFSMTMQGPGGSKTVSGTYRTGLGDAVYMDHLSEPVGGKSVLEDDITIVGDQLTARDPDGTTAVFSRVH